MPVDIHALASLAKVRCVNLEDSVTQIKYLVDDAQYDKAAEYCMSHNHMLNQLAGALAQLIPVTPRREPPMPEIESPYRGA